MDLPEPLLPADVDLRDFPDMPFAVARFRDSGIALKNPEETLAALFLWCASWHQVPAASLPNGERDLASLAGFGRGMEDWRRVRRGAMHRMILCSDDRYWHPVVAAKAAYAFNIKLADRHKKLNDRIRKANVERAARGESALPWAEHYKLKQDDLDSSGIPRWHYVDSRGNEVTFRRNERPVPPESDLLSAGIPAPKEKGREVKGSEGTRTSTSLGASPLGEHPAGLNGHRKKQVASRLPGDWKLPDAWRDWAMQAYGVDAQKAVRMSLEFRDYWSALPDNARARKTDWEATWRNSVRKKMGDG